MPRADRALREAHAAAGDFFRNELLGSDGCWAPGYLTDRGLGHVLRRSSPWKVGYAPDGWAYLVGHLRHQGFEDRDLVDAGLASVTKNGYLVDRFRDRIMFDLRCGRMLAVWPASGAAENAMGMSPSMNGMNCT